MPLLVRIEQGLVGGKLVPPVRRCARHMHRLVQMQGSKAIFVDEGLMNLKINRGNALVLTSRQHQRRRQCEQKTTQFQRRDRTFSAHDNAYSAHRLSIHLKQRVHGAQSSWFYGDWLQSYQGL